MKKLYCLICVQIFACQVLNKAVANVLAHAANYNYKQTIIYAVSACSYIYIAFNIQNK